MPIFTNLLGKLEFLYCWQRYIVLLSNLLLEKVQLPLDIIIYHLIIIIVANRWQTQLIFAIHGVELLHHMILALLCIHVLAEMLFFCAIPVCMCLISIIGFWMIGLLRLLRSFHLAHLL